MHFLLLNYDSAGEGQFQGLSFVLLTTIALTVEVNAEILPVAKYVCYNCTYRNWEITTRWICEIDLGQNSF